jgi:hypothetical protein
VQGRLELHIGHACRLQFLGDGPLGFSLGAALHQGLATPLAAAW